MGVQFGCVVGTVECPNKHWYYTYSYRMNAIKMGSSESILTHFKNITICARCEQQGRMQGKKNLAINRQMTKVGEGEKTVFPSFSDIK